MLPIPCFIHPLSTLALRTKGGGYGLAREFEPISCGGVYQVGTGARDIGEKTRGVKIEAKEGKQESLASEFYEYTVVIKTTP
jgi:hypothetical protein